MTLEELNNLTPAVFNNGFDLFLKKKTFPNKQNYKLAFLKNIFCIVDSNLLVSYNVSCQKL